MDMVIQVHNSNMSGVMNKPVYVHGVNGTSYMTYCCADCNKLMGVREELYSVTKQGKGVRHIVCASCRAKYSNIKKILTIKRLNLNDSWSEWLKFYKELCDM